MCAVMYDAEYGGDLQAFDKLSASVVITQKETNVRVFLCWQFVFVENCTCPEQT